MLNKRKVIVLGFLLVLLFVYWLQRPKAEQPWLETEKEEDDMSLTDELVKSTMDPLNFYATSDELAKGRGVIAPIANVTYVMLYVPAATVYSMAPLHRHTTLERFPYHHIYSEIGAKVGDELVTDVVSELPLFTLKEDSRLNSYRIQRFGLDNDFNWPIKDYWVGSKGEDSLMKMVSWNIIKRAYNSAPESMQWFVLLDERSYISSVGLEILLKNLDPFDKIVKISDESSGNGMLNVIFSRAAIEFLVHNEQTLSVQHPENLVMALKSEPSITVSTLEARNISRMAIKIKDWCSEGPAVFTDLDSWEIQSLYHREMKYTNSTASGSMMIDYYNDYMKPYIQEIQGNWWIYPSGVRFNNSVTINGEKLEPQTLRQDCQRLCNLTQECIGWQWIRDKECQFETQEVKRGISYNPKYRFWNPSESRLYVSGWIISRLKHARTASACDSDDNTNELMSQEGWFRSIRALIHLQKSEILRSAKNYIPGN